MHLADFVAGSVGGAFGVAVGYPLDTVKVRMQTRTRDAGVWECVRSTCRTEGVRGFYRGMSMPLSTVSIGSSLVFGTYRNVLHLLQELRHRSSSETLRRDEIFLSGFSGGVAQVCVQTHYKHHNYYCLINICVCVCVYKVSGQQTGWPVVLLAGGVSGMCGWAVGTPMDVIKARLQVSGVSGQRYRGFFHCLSHSVRTEGLSVLFRGLTVNCIRAFPVNMSVFAMYELVIRVLRPPP
ncbi:solute carrier family 25 member 47-B [Puntigrus tetrazona]|uniref:solute carrier family 25 member 47-B n=1 Tax=Puntigrus tetrazona TaxID=1606681 RepID=UPI001C8AE7BC|nr:solute carrier family 25 member 47-B [Puntigrus tetrazona]